MIYTGERFLPEDNRMSLMALEHFHRYLFACSYVKGKKCLDIACGEAYGSALLAEQAEEVVGCDVDAEAVAWAKHKYQKNNLSYQIADITKLDFPDASFDVVTCFETIEHIEEEAQKKALLELKRVLKSNGILFISTPNVTSGLYVTHNKYHLHEMETQEFKTFLGQSFNNIVCLGQSVYVSSIISSEHKGPYRFLTAKKEICPQNDKYIIAACSNGDLPQFVGKSLYIDDSNSILVRLTKIRNKVGWAIPAYNFLIQLVSYFIRSKNLRTKLCSLKW